MIYAIMAQIIGKENICFLLCPLRVAPPYLNTLRKPTTQPTKLAKECDLVLHHSNELVQELNKARAKREEAKQEDSELKDIEEE